jgi:hypothetical protein
MKDNKNRNGVYFDQNGVFHECILHIERKTLRLFATGRK